MKFRLIPPGEFLMGDARYEDEQPVHQVRLTKPFYLGVFPVTQEEYQRVMGSNPSHSQGARLPVERVSWEDAQEFLQRLAKAEPGTNYRLPTEAEWEYACRAGTTTSYWFGGALNGEQANCDGNCPHGTESKGPPLMRPVEVGRYGANPFGLFDQHGNVWEWCQDWYDKNYYQQFANKTAVDPTGPASGSSIVCRGGSWDSSAFSCRSALRGYCGRSCRYFNVGFRVVMS